MEISSVEANLHLHVENLHVCQPLNTDVKKLHLPGQLIGQRRHLELKYHMQHLTA